jgi:hypothetical protein
VGDENATTTGAVVYLLAELRSDGRGSVHEIGSRARVLGSHGGQVTLAIACGEREEVVSCPRDLVAQEQRSLAARRRLLPSGPGARATRPNA